MKNIINFFYNINIDIINKINNNYFFDYKNDSYMLTEYNRNLEEANDIYLLNQEMIKNNILTYKIILTKDNSILFIDNNIYYILMIIPKIKNRNITFEDIIRYRYKPVVLLNKITYSNWPSLWENKIEYIENQFKDLSIKYKTINKSINYYIGIWENAISYYNNNNIKIENEVCNKRVTINTDILSFINPLNIIIDTKIRDVAEYIKSYILEENFSEQTIIDFLDKIKLNREDSATLISRLLFPSYYFDLYEEIIKEEKKEEIIKKIIKKNNNIICMINTVFKYYKKFNIEVIDWIKKEDFN